ncbi:hypothetical protein CIL05_02730 [Virgibacillus profundi]|uniref:RNA polymerase sigma-70 region 2 domain-containing protein n=1 Tax=Virgibacillus profundi TaxID=2024555 RepID=A0A2A2IHW8_9BACI|nr:sigma-70 family RNA polymerase sigma factor [Virgibacillus profundi]PAV31591.1 hypothetical protein CIL05_02730 [Virgibacillus profundi]PXY55777.1 sigma-70 family RNA polymerase sigma factor [Virgibacillus profundi]
MGENKNQFTFEEIFKQNERRIHFHINRLNIQDSNQDFYREGIFALWNAYETYKPDKGPMATYFNYNIRNRLIDMIRKDNRRNEVQETFIIENIADFNDGNYIRSSDSSTSITNVSDTVLENQEMWQQLKAQLTENQWKWVYYHIIDGMTLKDIAFQENKTLEAVKSWGKQVRKKLRDNEFRKVIDWKV